MESYIYRSICAAWRRILSDICKITIILAQELILTDICWWSYNDRYMKTYMNEICSHISVDIKVYWPIYVNCHKYRSIYAQNWILKIFIYRSKNAKFQHISVKIWILENFHISVNIELAYIGQYTNFNIDRYMVTYFVCYNLLK